MAGPRASASHRAPENQIGSEIAIAVECEVRLRLRDPELGVADAVDAASRALLAAAF